MNYPPTHHRQVSAGYRRSTPITVSHLFVSSVNVKMLQCIVLTAGCLLSVSLLAQTTDEKKPAVVELDRYIVKSEKELSFTLPLDAVAGTASYLGLSNRDMPVSISVIHQEQIQMRGFRTAVEAIEGAVGMAGGTQFGSIPGYSTRGFTGNNVTILRDGIRQNTASQSSRSIETFTLDRVEVLKGPASIMYGEGAVGGAVNYLTKRPQNTFGAELFTSYSSWNTWRLGAGFGGPIVKDKLLYRLDISHNSTDGYVDRYSSERSAMAGALQWNVNPRFTTSFHFDFLVDDMESYYGQPVIYDGVINTTIPGAVMEVRKVVTATDRLVNARIDPRTRKTNYNIQDNYVETENGFARWKADFKLSDKVTLNNMAYVATQNLDWVNLENNTYNPATGLVDLSELAYIYRNDTMTGDRATAVWNSSLAGRANRLIGGFDISRNDITRGTRPASVPGTLASVTLINPEPRFAPAGVRYVKNAGIVIDTSAFFIENLFEPTDRLKVIAGLRYDDIGIERANLLTPTVPNFTKSYNPTTGRVGVVWTVRPEMNVYASYSTAAEPVVQLVSLTATQNDFGLQKGKQYEIGLKQTFWQGRADTTIALYHIEKNDLLTQTVIDDVRVSQQIGSLLSQGVEAALSLALSKQLRMEANFAYTDAWYEDFNENLGTGVVSREGNRPPNVAEIVANVHLAYKWGKGFTLNGGPRYVGERMANNANTITTPAYTTLDAAFGYTLGKTTFTLRGRNLLDEEYEEWATAAGAMRRLADPLSIEFTVRYRY